MVKASMLVTLLLSHKATVASSSPFWQIAEWRPSFRGAARSADPRSLLFGFEDSTTSTPDSSSSTSRPRRHSPMLKASHGFLIHDTPDEKDPSKLLLLHEPDWGPNANIVLNCSGGYQPLTITSVENYVSLSEEITPPLPAGTTVRSTAGAVASLTKPTLIGDNHLFVDANHGFLAEGMPVLIGNRTYTSEHTRTKVMVSPPVHVVCGANEPGLTLFLVTTTTTTTGPPIIAVAAEPCTSSSGLQSSNSGSGGSSTSSGCSESDSSGSSASGVFQWMLLFLALLCCALACGFAAFKMNEKPARKVTPRKKKSKSSRKDGGEKESTHAAADESNPFLDRHDGQGGADDDGSGAKLGSRSETPDAWGAVGTGSKMKTYDPSHLYSSTGPSNPYGFSAGASPYTPYAPYGGLASNPLDPASGRSGSKGKGDSNGTNGAPGLYSPGGVTAFSSPYLAGAGLNPSGHDRGNNHERESSTSRPDEDASDSADASKRKSARDKNRKGSKSEGDGKKKKGSKEGASSGDEKKKKGAAEDGGGTKNSQPYNVNEFANYRPPRARDGNDLFKGTSWAQSNRQGDPGFVIPSHVSDRDSDSHAASESASESLAMAMPHQNYMGSTTTYAPSIPQAAVSNPAWQIASVPATYPRQVTPPPTTVYEVVERVIESPPVPAYVVEYVSPTVPVVPPVTRTSFAYTPPPATIVITEPASTVRLPGGVV